MGRIRSNPLILVVEDDPSVREALRLVLEDEGHAVELACDGAEALEMLRAGLEPALILLDLMMPRMDGWEFCRVRRQDPRSARIPLVMLTATGGPTRDAPYLDVAALLAKPVDADELLRTIARFLPRAD